MGVVSEIESIGKILREAGKIELYEKLLAIQEQNKGLRQEILELREKLRIKESLLFRENAYFLRDEKDKKEDGPYCSNCWDNEGKLIRLHSETSIPSDLKYYRCPKCATIIS